MGRIERKEGRAKERGIDTGEGIQIERRETLTRRENEKEIKWSQEKDLIIRCSAEI